LAVRLVYKEQQTGIRPLNPARDLGQLADLIENAFGHELTDDGMRVLREIRLLSWLGPLNVLLDGSSSDIDGMFRGFVWEQDGRVVGNVTVNRPTGHTSRWQISNVAVLDRFRRQGIGQKLVEAAIDLVVKRGGQTAYLLVRHDNPAALRLYRAFGFAEVDRTTDLKLDPLPVRASPLRTQLLHRLRPAQEHSLYDLVRRAEGTGRRWLYTIRRSQYVQSPDQRLLRRLESLFTSETRLCWGTHDETDMHAAMILRATRLWNMRPHRLQLWVHPNWRGRIEDRLAQDIVSILSQSAVRATLVSLPDCEERAIEALIEHGFRQVRTLILMRLDV
jgi:ribosomal protein S18 acetylase RimI-like enzyme